MKKLSLLIAILMILSALLVGCGNEEVVFSNDKIVQEIISADKNVVKTVGLADDTFKLNGVSEDESSSHVANTKFELNLDSVTSGNVYDPSEVDIVGQFVSPSGELYEMPAFWYEDCDRYFEEYDLQGEFDIADDEYFAQYNAEIVGVLDEIDGVTTPVAKVKFNNTDGSGSNGGAVFDRSYADTVYDTISLWLRADENFTTTGLYLYFYNAGDQAWVELPELTTEWKLYTFTYGTDEDLVNQEVVVKNDDGTMTCGDFTHANAESPLHVGKMYSARIQTKDGSTATGDVYMSQLCFYNSQKPTHNTVLSDFVGGALKKYKEGDLFGEEVIAENGIKNFKIRFRFTEVGEWTYRIVGKKNGETKFTYASVVTATENTNAEENRGIVRVEQTLKRNFVFEDGTPYVPIGMNLAYSVDPTRGSYDYEVYFPKMADAGMNFARAWLTYVGHGVQTVADGILNFDSRQDKAYQFDNVVSLAEEYGLYLQIPMLAVAPFRKDADDGLDSYRWDSSVFNKLNGGYLDEPWEFLTDSRAIEDTKKLFRYYVARYSYSRNILNWEIFNEIGMDSSWYGVHVSEQQAQDWANEIGGFLHTTDPYDHLVSVSSGNNHDDLVYGAEEMDFVSFHSYVFGRNYATSSADECYRLWQKFGKPVLIGEIGASGTSEAYNYNRDPNGMVVRQTALATPMGGSAAGAMTFWWQQVNNYDQYGNVTPAVNMFKLFDDKFVTMDTITTDSYTLISDGANRVRALGYICSDTIYAYVMNTNYNYSNVTPPAITNISIAFSNMDNGTYNVRVFNTQTGVVDSSSTLTVSNGQITIQIESLSQDVAYLIEKA